MHKLISTPSGDAASRFAFGTMQFGVGTPDAECDALYRTCRDAGINVFDTAYGYTGGASEKILGRLIAQDRDAIVLMTKCAHPAPSTAANITAQFDESRTRLGQDMIDVLFLHRWDDSTPLEQTFEALARMKEAGAIRSVGVSNFSAWQVMKARSVAADFDMSVDVIQPMYSLVKRQVEVEILPMARSEGVAVTPYSPLGGGLLTGKYRTGASGRLKENREYTARYAEEWTFDTAGALTDYAAETGVHPATLAVAWVARNPDISAPLISGKSLEQLQPSLDAMSYAMSDAVYAHLCTLGRTPPPATDRLEEQG